MNTTRLIRALYPKTRRIGRWHKMRRVLRQLGQDRRILVCVAAMLVPIFVCAVLYFHYYNRLVGLKNDAETAWAQVEVERQRRHHLQQNLTKIIVDYAAHERSLHQKLTELRAGRRSGPIKTPPKTSTALDNLLPDGATVDQLSPAQLAKLFPTIQRKLVAERYASLRLSENYQQFSKSLVETETRIAQAIISFNGKVNLYTTLLNQFPARFFGWLAGFEPIDLYQPSAEKLDFKIIN